MRERVDLHKAMREALPVYEAPASLQAWAREEAKKADQEALPARELPTAAPRARVRRFSDWRIAAGFLVAAVVGWGAASLRPIGGISPATTATTNQLVDAHVRSLLPNHL